MTGEIFIRAQGRAAVEYHNEVLGPLTLEETSVLQEERGTKPSPLKRLQERHHALARLLAAGMKPGLAALEIGYDRSHVSILLGDPTFKELVEMYRSGEERLARNIAEKLTGVTAAAMDLLEDRLTNAETQGDITTTQLREIIETGADRLGLGPQTTATNVNIHVGLADRMKAAREKAREASRTITLEPRVVNG